MHDEALEQLQTKIAFLERANTELSDVLYRQQQELRDLGARLQALAERVGTAPEERSRPIEEERPPHY
jgi:uncharacterized coiled-coil protein SlyX